jgi:hypothetical protein
MNSSSLSLHAVVCNCMPSSVSNDLLLILLLVYTDKVINTTFLIPLAMHALEMAQMHKVRRE